MEESGRSGTRVRGRDNRTYGLVEGPRERRIQGDTEVVGVNVWVNTGRRGATAGEQSAFSVVTLRLK